MTEANLKSHISNLKSKHVIIVAGGSGTRMQAAVPKQFLLINGLPVLMHTMLAFHNSGVNLDIVLVLHPDFHEYWHQLCKKHSFSIPHLLVAGGETRFHSVKNGLNSIHGDEQTLIAVHDAVRPLTSAFVIQTSYNHAGEHGNAVTAVKSRDSVRRGTTDKSVSLLRDEIYLVQTPQTFKAGLLRKAYEQAFSPNFTDDASVVEQTGIDIQLTEGSHENIKITFPEDIAIAELLLRKKATV
ncbi:2-C-methyl-D-erythritol 4-phosphate cytidylyltransferase [Mucilaginibacter ginsenosidivorax]|uniref:2-C-methyl-D-erythritol 4-phosphate cytidylyltransferase n=1 Tax=Mucilaginibacter ginsenosidivorax TaxID=862126 RepID=A0A5B8VU22_9SPHI|nr:2-C-methyl-D-erythritol 4-phosphate cytidylyltransferase [Mucilaginibacter ginsenosidivorax]QEC74950.1 2-C-methyl-D-erythritol 4-phosphate cytidylyltransferase [Mucilaginibacter ginsenosidivorax]